MTGDPSFAGNLSSRTVSAVGQRGAAATPKGLEQTGEGTSCLRTPVDLGRQGLSRHWKTPLAMDFVQRQFGGSLVPRGLDASMHSSSPILIGGSRNSNRILFNPLT